MYGMLRAVPTLTHVCTLPPTAERQKNPKHLEHSPLNMQTKLSDYIQIIFKKACTEP